MSTIVYNSITRNETPRSFYAPKSLPTVWREASDYTQAKARCDVDGALMGLIGRRDSQGNVWVCEARTGFTDWRQVNSFHFALLEHFERVMHINDQRIISGPADIDSAEAKQAAIHLIAAECGINAAPSHAKAAALTVRAELMALGLPAGDWVVMPMLRAFSDA